MLTAFNHSGNYGHPPLPSPRLAANFLCRIEGERERERENNWWTLLVPVKYIFTRYKFLYYSYVGYTESRESRVRQIDLKQRCACLYSCRWFLSFFLSFFLWWILFAAISRQIRLPIVLIQRREIFFPFLTFLSAFAREISIVHIEIDCYPILLRYYPHKTYGYLFALWSEFYKQLDGDR